MSTTHTDPRWHTDGVHSRDQGKHAGFPGIVRRTCDDHLRRTPGVGESALVHRSALGHHLTTYRSPDLPPSWLVVETQGAGYAGGT